MAPVHPTLPGQLGQEQHEAAETTRVTLAQLFTVFWYKLERMEVFKFMGWLFAHDDNNTQTM
jgi:hypothetical protein